MQVSKQHPAAEGFTAVPIDRRLSMTAQGLLGELLATPGGEPVTAGTLIRRGPDDLWSTLSALAELEEAGYATLTGHGSATEVAEVRDVPVS